MFRVIYVSTCVCFFIINYYNVRLYINNLFIRIKKRYFAFFDIMTIHQQAVKDLKR